MNLSFYTAALAARGQQEKMNVIANNLANVNTTGYKAKNEVFSALMQFNMRDAAEVDSRLQAGVGMVAERTDINFDQSILGESTGAYDYAISGNGFFMVQNPVNQEVTYTRDGNFSLSQRGEEFYLVTNGDKLVLDDAGNSIQVTEEGLQGTIGIYEFPIQNGMLSVGSNEFMPVEKSGTPYLSTESTLLKGYLEQSNVNLADEMSKTVETSRAYSYVMKMVSTTDEIEQTINNLRQ